MRQLLRIGCTLGLCVKTLAFNNFLGVTVTNANKFQTKNYPKSNYRKH